MTEKQYTYDEIHHKIHKAFVDYYRSNGEEMRLSERLLFDDIQNFILVYIEMNFNGDGE